MTHINQTSSANLKPIVLAMTGASGAVYAARLLQLLLNQSHPVHLVVSSSGRAVIRQELGVDLKLGTADLAIASLEAMLSANNLLLSIEDANTGVRRAHESGQLHVHREDDYFTPVASGSFLTEGMVICPCSGSTLSGIARAASQNLIQRAAEVHLKEHRKLIVVPRETPLSVLQLENMLRLAQAGVVILPAAPGWYHGVTGMLSLVDFVVARILDQLGIPNTQIQRWSE